MMRTSNPAKTTTTSPFGGKIFSFLFVCFVSTRRLRGNGERRKKKKFPRIAMGEVDLFFCEVMHSVCMTSVQTRSSQSEPTIVYDATKSPKMRYEVHLFANKLIIIQNIFSNVESLVSRDTDSILCSRTTISFYVHTDVQQENKQNKSAKKHR